MSNNSPYYPLSFPPSPTGLNHFPDDPASYTHTWPLENKTGQPNSSEGWYGTVNMAGQALTNRSLTMTSAWEKIFSQTIHPDEKGTHTVTVSSGTTITDTNGTTIGAGVEYKGISAEFSHTTSHSVEFSKSRSTTEAIEVSTTSGPVTVIRWQQVNTWMLRFDAYQHVGMPWYMPDIDKHWHGLTQTFVDRRPDIYETRWPMAS